jgi:hypothetical protein
MMAYMVAGQYITILWSALSLTTIHFNTKVNCVFAHGMDSKGNKVISINKVRGGKSISISPTMKFSTNFNCYGEDESVYFFNVKYSDKKFNKNIIVRHAGHVSGGSIVFETGDYAFYESKENYFVVNRSKKKLNVNEKSVPNSSVLSKWQPVNINGRLTWF